MSVGLQAALGTGAAAFIVLLLAIVHRGGRKVWIPVCVCLTLAAAAGGVFGERIFAPQTAEETEEETGSRRGRRDRDEEEEDEDEGEEGSLAIETAYALMEEDELDLAASVLDDYLSYGLYDAEYLACKARLAMLRGDYTEAEALYGAAEALSGEDGDSFRKERKALDDWKEAKSEEAEEELRAQAKDGVSKAVKRISRTSEKAAAALKAMRDLSADPYLSDEEKKEKKEAVLEFAEGLTKSVRSRALNRVRLTGDLYAEDYSALLERLGDDPDGDSLLVVSELIRAEEISRKDLRDVSFLEEQAKDAQFVLDWIDGHRYGGTPLTSEEKEYLNGVVERLEGVADGGEETFRNYLHDQMEQRAQAEKANASKLYLELSQTAREDGDDAKAADYLNKALEKAADSDDSEYASAAAGINAVRQDPDDTEARKSLSDYAGTMVENRYPEGVPVRDAVYGGQPQDPDDPDDRQPSADEDLTTYVDNTVNQSLGQINVVAVNTDEFPKVRAAVAMDETLGVTPEEFKNHVAVYDTDSAVDDYTVTKIVYSKVNLIICVDDSGSMSGARAENLRNALLTFLTTDLSGVDVAIIPFSDHLKAGAGLGSSREDLERVANGLYGSGGTSIMNAAQGCAEMFPNNTDELNILILMSDGEDNMPSESALAQLKSICVSKGVSLYTMGLGSDVDSNLLASYSAMCGGSYYYVNDSQTLLEFYHFIFKLSRNRFEIAYEPVDTARAVRYAEVRHDAGPTVHDRMDYYLYDRTDISVEDLENAYQVKIDGVVFNGLKNRLMYPSDKAQETALTGGSFDEHAQIKVSLHGVATYECKTEYVSAEEYKVTVPANVVSGIYDVYVEYNGKRAVFVRGFIMASNNRNLVKFGEYVFTATNVSEANGKVVMDGVVQLNGWLTFIDPVTLTGDLENDYTVTMSAGRSMVVLTNDETAKGLTKVLAVLGVNLDLPDYSDIRLYNDRTTSGKSEDYPVDTAALYDNLLLIGMGDLISPSVKLYPDRLVVDAGGFSLGVDEIINLVRSVTGTKMFDFDKGLQVILSQNAIDCEVEISAGDKREDSKFLVKIGNMRAELLKGSFSLKINTREGKLELEAETDIADVIEGIGFSLKLDDWKLDEFLLHADFDVPANICGVSVTFHKFRLGVTDMKDKHEVVEWTLKGQCDISVYKLDKVVPGIKKFIKDADKIDFFALEEVTLEFRIWEPYISVSAKANLLGHIELGSAKAQLGFGFPYSNGLLGFEDTTVSGFNCELSIGPKVDESFFKATLQGTGKLPVHTRAVGLGLGGMIDIEVGWWFPIYHFNAKGEFFLGMYEQHNGKWVFAILADGSGAKPFRKVFGESDVKQSRKY